MTELKDSELDGPAAELTRIVKRSGAFDNIKKAAVDELQSLEQVQVQSSLMLSVMKVLFEQQNRSSKGMSLAERRIQLKDNIRKGSMYKSLTNYFQESDSYKDSCERLYEEVDRVVAETYPDYKPSEKSNTYTDIMPSLQLPKDLNIPSTSSMFQLPLPDMTLPSMGIPPPVFPPPMGYLPPSEMVFGAEMENTLTNVNGVSAEVNASVHSTPIKAELVDTTVDNNDHMDMELDSGSSNAPSPAVVIKQEIVDDAELPPPPMPPPNL
ncbi:unnamed protein product [Bursaphelenchus okinawaensis]|uniref:Uncharacterized protein n=1 Tax=Bursaphelenchus okinawaensis TaxID=465554 RepID=A0A811KHD2_9BILA|nr:unnamed protein product [Bursaphelenchus okinawaensis]CAG9104562.1 unnamed protein product [Bursaphelenchus okinawaensis]